MRKNRLLSGVIALALSLAPILVQGAISGNVPPALGWRSVAISAPICGRASGFSAQYLEWVGAIPMIQGHHPVSETLETQAPNPNALPSRRHSWLLVKTNRSRIGIFAGETGSISGYVYEDDGTTPIEGAWVYAMDTGFQYMAGDHSQADGTYTITSLSAGHYYLAVSATDYGGVYYDGGCDDPRATQVEVVPPHDTAGIDFLLAPEATVSGHVYQSNGATPIEGATVSIWPLAGGQIRSGKTASDGSYAVGQLSTCEYRLEASAPEYVTREYPHTLPITAPEALTDVDFQLILSSTLDLTYTVSVEIPLSHTVHISITVDNIADDKIIFETAEFRGRFIEPQDLQAHDVENNPLSIAKVSDNESQGLAWEISTGGRSSITVDYTSNPSTITQTYGLRGYLGENFGLFEGQAVFLLPENDEEREVLPIRSLKVVFRLPEGWNVYTPWNKIEGYHCPRLSVGDAVLKSLSRSTVALGNFDLYERTIGNTVVQIALYGGWDGETRHEMAETAFNIFEYQTELFGASVGERYLAVLSPLAEDNQDIYTGEWSTSQGYSVMVWGEDEVWPSWDMFSHQIFHRWNGWHWGLYLYQVWFTEGPNVFYEGKTLAQLRLSTPYYGDFTGMLSEYYHRYMEEYAGTPKDKPLFELEHGKDDNFLIYRKGALVSFMIAREIYERTRGEKTFDDFMEYLFAHYGYHSQPCPEEKRKEALEILTNSDFTAFFNSYIYGAETLNLDWAFEDTDGEGLTNAMEIAWNTDPENSDTDGDGYNDAVEVAGFSDPLDPSSIPHLVYLPIAARDYVPPALSISIDGEGGDWQSYTPVATDPQGDTTGGPHTDMKAVFAETGPNYVYLMVEAYDPPLLSEAAKIELHMDLVDSGEGTWTLQNIITSNGSFYACTDIDGDGEWEEYPVPGARVAWGSVMELRLPLWQLGNPDQVDVTFVNFWCDVGGEWTWVDMIIP